MKTIASKTSARTPRHRIASPQRRGERRRLKHSAADVEEWNPSLRAMAFLEIDHALIRWSALCPAEERPTLVSLLASWIRWLRSASPETASLRCECNQEGAERINIGRSIWGICRVHRVRWRVGEDLGSWWWEGGTAETFAARAALLDEYADVSARFASDR